MRLAFSVDFRATAIQMSVEESATSVHATHGMANGHCYRAFSKHIHSHKCILCLSVSLSTLSCITPHDFFCLFFIDAGKPGNLFMPDCH